MYDSGIIGLAGRIHVVSVPQHNRWEELECPTEASGDYSVLEEWVERWFDTAGRYLKGSTVSFSLGSSHMVV